MIASSSNMIFISFSSSGNTIWIGILSLITFFKHETWKTGCTWEDVDNSNLYAIVPILYNTLQGPYYLGDNLLSFLACLRHICLYGCSRKNTQSPIWKLLSLWCWSTCCFIQFCTRVRLSFKSWRTCCWCLMWSSTTWTLEFSFKYDVMDGGWYP